MSLVEFLECTSFHNMISCNSKHHFLLPCWVKIPWFECPDDIGFHNVHNSTISLMKFRLKVQAYMAVLALHSSVWMPTK